MMRSLYSGVAGLKTHQTKMDVIGNNIANVNTTAFKSSSITFSELMSQTTQKASGPNAATGTGGVNARQIGLGVKSGAININITGQGSTQSTGNPFDIMINGDNFFVVNNGTENFFTRDGSFYVDGGGNLAMTSTGYNVMGWQLDEETGEFVGEVCYYYDMETDAHGTGVLIEGRHRGKGYGTAGLKLLTEHAFAHPEIEQLMAELPLNRESAIRMYLAAGFREESTEQGICRLILRKE